MRPDIEFLPRAEEDRAWTLMDGTRHRFTRLGDGAATLLRGLDGTRNLDQVRADLAPTVPRRDIDAALRGFTDLGLLVGTEAEQPKRGRFRFQPPAALQVTVLDKPRMLAPGRLLPRILASRAAAVLCLLAAASGLVAACLDSAELTAVAYRPLPWHYWVIALGVVVAVNALHEFAHGAVLARYGGHTHRVGVMLFYFAPAMFCDVTDLWRLRTRGQRVLVALAGVICQLSAAGLLALGSTLCGGGAGRLLGLCALLTAVTGVLNLLPFIRLDGYIALTAWVNIPNLRDKSMADCRALVGWALFGGPRPVRRLSDGWAVFGAACLLYPCFLVGNVLVIAHEALMAYGPWGALSWLGLLCGVVGHLLRRAVELYRASGARTPLRGLVTLAVLAAGLVLLGRAQPYTESVYGAYVRADDRHAARLLFPEAPGASAPSPGDPVQLLSGGVLGRRPVGTATTGAEGPRGTAPLETFVPLQDVPGDLPARSYRLDAWDVRPGAPARGVAVARTGTTTWLAHVTEAAVGRPARMVGYWFT
ncbi:daptide biosynthesis intramembrane metalloprotease [Streptomyces sp. NPDC050600]|uniref:daptide biosynthesis intramembrane metalloprotease n=1 Tax=Streptomyces sp. NPDC050600 TaxID=3157213 RepID=UPI00342BBC86